MNINEYTTPEDIVSIVTGMAPPSIVNKLLAAITEFEEQAVSRYLNKPVLENKVENYRLDENEVERIQLYARALPSEQRIRLMRLTDEEMETVLKKNKVALYGPLYRMAKGDFVDRLDDTPITVPLFLEFCSHSDIKYTEKNLLAYMAKKSIPHKFLVIMNEIIENDLKERDDLT